MNKSDRISELGGTLRAALEDFLDETRSHIEYLEAQNKLLQDEIEALRTEIREWRTKSGRLK